ncbi:MAG: lamin tail domain-containing protein [Myxococcales bacterium]|nr:lamin tail domain-containing protein [Myxococcales bacterium]
MIRKAPALSLLGALGLGVAAALAPGCGGDELPPCEAMLAKGELVITELLSDPAGADTGKEWIELYNGSGRSVPLAGLVVAYSRVDGSADKTHTIEGDLELAAGAYLVLGGVLADQAPAHVDYGYGNDLGSLGNDEGVLQLQCGATIVDAVTYKTKFEEASWALDGSEEPDATRNDDMAHWCHGDVEYEAGQLGTPGEPNPACKPDVTSEDVTRCVDGEALRDVVRPLPGDLIFTEVMADPAGADAGVDEDKAEWFELYVARDVDLNGLGVGLTSVDGAVDESAPVPGNDAELTLETEDDSCMRVTAGSYLLFSRKADPVESGGLPEPYATFSFSLRNSGPAALFVGFENASLGIDVLDLAAYDDDVTAGAARALAPAALDYLANNDPASWCPAVEVYGPAGAGSPGAPNPACADDPGSLCREGDSLRAPVPPELGDLIITEVMADPDAAASETDGEWFEVEVTRDVDLRGLELGKDDRVAYTLTDGDACLRVSAGARLVFARNDDPVQNGGLPQVDFTYGSLSLTNAGATLQLGLAGVVLDAAPFTAETGASYKLAPTAIDATLNDDPMNWCTASDAEVYGAGDFGTPGGENPPCSDMPDPPGGTCLDGGVPRDPVPPVAGDLVITEIMSDPSAVTDAEGEWFEVLATAPVDLNGLEMHKDPQKLIDAPEVLDAADCLHLEPGERVVFARGLDPLVNGGIDAADFVFAFGLNNASSGVYLGHGGALVEEVTFVAGPDAGVARSLDPSANASANDDVDAAPWCDAVAPYGDGDLGSPGQENPACG